MDNRDSDFSEFWEKKSLSRDETIEELSNLDLEALFESIPAGMIVPPILEVVADKFLKLEGGTLTGTLTLSGEEPIKFQEGNLVVPPEAGLIEYTGLDLYFTDSNNARHPLYQSFPMAELSIQENAVVTPSPVTSEYNKVMGITTLTEDPREFSDGGQSNRLQYIGEKDKMFHIACTVSFSSAGANDICFMRIGKNGTTVSASTVRRKTGGGGDVGSTAMHLMLDLSKNDYIEVFSRNSSDTDGLTITEMNLFAMGVGY